MSTIRFNDKDPGDEITVEFDFSAAPEAIAAPSLTITLFAGSDPDAAAMLAGTPSVLGRKVYQRVRAGLDGCDYLLQCSALSGVDRYSIEAVLPVRVRPALVGAVPRYLTEAEFEQRFGESELSDLLREMNSYTRAENDAASLVDGYLSARYTLPLVSVPGIVKGWVADITRFKLWDEAAPEEVRQRYEDAIAGLKDLARGLISLPPGSDGTPAAAQTGLFFEGYSAERVFTMDSLKRF